MDNWQTAKLTLSTRPFPDELGEQQHISESHVFDKTQKHDVEVYMIRTNLNGFPLEHRYTYCPMCRKVVNKVSVLFNNKESLVYQRWYKKNGKDIDTTTPRNIQEPVKDIQKALKEKSPNEIFTGDLDSN